MSRNHIISMALFFLLSWTGLGCSSVFQPVPKNRSAPPAIAFDQKASRTIPGEFTEEKALKLLYNGTYNSKDQLITWRPTKAEMSQFQFLDSNVKEVTTRVLFAQPFQKQDGIPRYFFLTQTTHVDNNCHPCGAAIGGALFSKVGNVWQIDLEQRFIINLGTFGSAPDNGELVKIGDDHYGVWFKPGFTGQGFTTESMLLLAEVDKNLRQIALVEETYEDNAGNCEGEVSQCWQFESKAQFVPGKNPPYYDLKVTTTGTQEIESKIRHFNQVRVYAFDGKEYKLLNSSIKSEN